MVLFSDEYKTLKNASDELRPVLKTVVSYNTESKIINWGKTDELEFISGDHNEEIYTIRVENGRRLEVTATHPMVRENGTVDRADNINPNDVLLTTEGPSKVIAIDKSLYTGKVWNIQSNDTNVSSNILVAEGFLTGSARFQNEWSDVETRLSVRKNLFRLLSK